MTNVVSASVDFVVVAAFVVVIIIVHQCFLSLLLDLDRLFRSFLSPRSRSRSRLLERRRSRLRLLFLSFSFRSLRLSRLLERLLRLRSLLRDRRRSDRLRDRDRDRFLLRLWPSAPLELDLASLKEMNVHIERQMKM